MISFTNDRIGGYVNAHSTAETEMLVELRRLAEEKLERGNMICGPIVGHLLKIFIKTGGYKRVLEIGSFIGYSAITMADAMGGGELITLELEKKYAEISSPYFERSPYNEVINQKIGPALELLQEIQGPFDLIFIDADKPAYKAYYEITIPMLSENGIMVIDNMLWSGEVINPHSEEAIALHELNEWINNDNRVHNLLLPVRDGIQIVALL